MKSESEIITFLKERLSHLVHIPQTQIRNDQPLDTHYGLGSMDILTLAGRLEDWLGVELDPERLFEDRTIQGLAAVAVDLQEIG